MAEIELGILGRQCLDRRIDKAGELIREVAAREVERNTAKARLSFRFRTANARIKLRKLCPSVEQ